MTREPDVISWDRSPARRREMAVTLRPRKIIRIARMDYASGFLVWRVTSQALERTKAGRDPD